MPWPIRIHEEPPQKPQPGDAWFAPWLVREADGKISEFFLSDAFLARWKGGDHSRLPLIVRLPGGVDFCVDGPAWENGNRRGSCWTVTGEAPLITVSPSINVAGTYHGWIQHGVVSDDCEGRRFP